MNEVKVRMKCKTVKRKLHAYLDKELNETQEAKIQRHLCHCSDCSRQERLLTGTLNALKSWQDVEPSDNFSATFWKKVDMQEASQSLNSGFLARLIHIHFAAAIATLLIIGLLLGCIVGIYLLPQGGETQAQQEYIDSFALDSFKALPPDSIGGVYFTLAKR